MVCVQGIRIRDLSGLVSRHLVDGDAVERACDLRVGVEHLLFGIECWGRGFGFVVRVLAWVQGAGHMGYGVGFRAAQP